MADDRRIIFSANVTPQETTTDEEGFTKTSILRQDTSGDLVSKRFGSKGNADDVNKDQWGEGWTSMFHPDLAWEDNDDVWNASVDYWSGIAFIGATEVRLGPADSTVVKFVYVKNVGDNAAQMTLNGTNYDLIIPVGGSVSFRGDGTNLQMTNVKVQRVSSDDTEIEYIIAK